MPKGTSAGASSAWESEVTDPEPEQLEVTDPELEQLEVESPEPEQLEVEGPAPERVEAGPAVAEVSREAAAGNIPPWLLPGR